MMLGKDSVLKVEMFCYHHSPRMITCTARWFSMPICINKSLLAHLLSILHLPLFEDLERFFGCFDAAEDHGTGISQ